jgi:hypothetical protein
MMDGMRARFEERAAILEFDGGFARPEAEARAFAECIALIDPAADRNEQRLIANQLAATGIRIPPRWWPR